MPHVDRQDSQRSEPGAQAAEADRRTPDAARTVLVIDDDPDLLEVTRFALESEGIEVETAKNGEEALALLAAGSSPALVLLDLMMPVMDGWTFVDELAKHPGLSSIPVVVMTAAERVEIPPRAVEVLRKPIELTTLLEVVERLVRGGDGSRARAG